MSARNAMTAFASLLLIAATVQSEVIPGRWELVDRLEPGTPIVLKLKAGERMDCSFKGSSPDDVSYIDDIGVERTMPKKEIQQIESQSKTCDSLKNGAGYGALLGAAGGIVGLAAYAKSVTASGPVLSGESAGAFIGAGLVGAGIGAVAGMAVDAATRRHKVFYKAR